MLEQVQHDVGPANTYIPLMHWAFGILLFLATILALKAVVYTREDGLSFAFLWAPRPEALKFELASRRRQGIRARASEARP